MSESSTPTTTNALVEQQGERRSKRRHRATVKRAVGSNESPAIWAARHQDGRAFDGDRVEFGFNLFHSEADATRLTATRAATAVRSFATLPNAIAWAKNRKSIVDKTEAAIVGDTWVSPAFPDIDGEDDTDVFLTIEVQAARSHGQSGNEIVGYDAWFDGKRELSNMSALPNANVSRAVIEGCMKAIEHARNPEDGFSDATAILLSSPSVIPYLAVSDARKGMPASCKNLAKSFRRTCQGLPHCRDGRRESDDFARLDAQFRPFPTFSGDPELDQLTLMDKRWNVPSSSPPWGHLGGRKTKCSIFMSTLSAPRGGHDADPLCKVVDHLKSAGEVEKTCCAVLQQHHHRRC